MKPLKFTARLEGRDGSQVAGLKAPFDVEQVFGTRGQVKVRGSLNGFPFRSSLMPMGGCHFMAINKTMREGAGVKAGDVAAFVMERDLEVRTVEAPPELKKELARSKKAAAKWETLSFTHKKEMARSITDAKQPETRTRRLAKIMDVLKTDKKWTG
ncbi:MAG TPA: YdeI/OmpD-associated family protein [Terriglobales bacterium]